MRPPKSIHPYHGRPARDCLERGTGFQHVLATRPVEQSCHGMIWLVRRVARYTLSAVTISSSLLLLGCAVLWALSYRIGFEIALEKYVPCANPDLPEAPVIARKYGASVDRGELGLLDVRPDLLIGSRPDVHAPGWHFVSAARRPPIPPYALARRGGGHHAGTFESPDGIVTDHWEYFGIPMWVVCAGLLVAPTIVGIRPIWRISMVRAGRCAKCGYDLRATPTRCPECGTIPKEK
jgi:hypothetical protein